MLGEVGIDPTDAGSGAVTGLEFGGAATSLLVLTPLAPAAIVAPLLGALVGGVAGGLSFAGNGLSDANRQAIVGAVVSLNTSVPNTDNPYALDAIVDAAFEMSRQIDQFLVRSADFVGPADVATLNSANLMLNDTRRAAYTKSADLRASGIRGVPLPAGAAQAALQAAAAAMAKAAQEALASKQTQSRVRLVVAAASTVALVGAGWWWYRRSRPSRSSPSGR